MQPAMLLSALILFYFPQGLVALLVRGLSGCTPDQVTAIPPDFIEQMGLKQSLTPSRSNGFLNMFHAMQKSAQLLALQQQQQQQEA